MATFEDGITRNRKVEVVIQSSQVPGDLTDYEWTVTEANLPSEIFDGADQAQNGGGDIRFSSDSDGNNQLAIDVVTFITDPTEGEAEINVLVPSVSGSVDTSIWVWYNTGTTASQPSPSSTFGSDNAYRSTAELVLTLNEDPAGTAPQFIDRTSNGNDGTANGSMTSDDSVTGKIGNAVNFEGPNDANRITVPHIIDPAVTDSTLALWCRSDLNALSNQIIFQQNDNGGTGRSWMFKRWDDDVLETFISGQGLQGNVLTVGQWFYCALELEGNARRLYQDGVLVSSDTRTPEAAGGSYNIGHHKDGIDDRSFDGPIDGVRMYSEGALGTDYHLTRHNNTDSPGTFAVAGTPEDTAGGAAGPPKGSLALLGCGL